jgi:hypothetical protein
MNPGAAEEFGKATGGFIDSMKAQPLALALVVMNFALLGFMFWNTHELNAQRERATKMFVDANTETEKLLANCVPTSDFQDLLKSLDDLRKREPK